MVAGQSHKELKNTPIFGCYLAFYSTYKRNAHSQGYDLTDEQELVEAWGLLYKIKTWVEKPK